MVLQYTYNLQGRVQFSTGGKVREPFGRLGVIPRPTVKSGWKKINHIDFMFSVALILGDFLFLEDL